MAKYLDQAGLIKLIGSLKEKNDARYLKVGETFAADVKFTNANLNGGAETTVSKALEVLIQNIVRQEQEAFDQASNMKAIEALISELDGKIDGVGQDLADEAAKVKALEDKVGKAADENGEGAEGLFAAVDANAAAIAAEVQNRKDAIDGIEDRLDILDALTGNGEGSGDSLDVRIKALEDDAALHADKTDVDAAVDALEKADQALADRIAAFEGDGEGSVAAQVADAKADAKAADDKAVAAQADVDALEKRLDDEGGLVDRIETNEAFVAAQPAIDQEQDRRIKALEDANAEGGAVKEAIDAVAKDLSDFEDEQAEKEAAQDAEIAAKVAQAAYDVKVAALEAEDERIAGLVATEQGRAEGVEQGLQAAINAINAAETGILDQAKAYADTQDQAAAQVQKQKDDAQDAKITALELAVGGGEEGQSLDEKIEAAEQSAKDYADTKITALVDSAPDAMNTLGELAKAIKDHTDVYEAYVNGVADLIATAKGEAIADAAGKDAALEAKLNKKIADDIAAESALRQAEEADIRVDFAAEDTKLSNRIKAIEDLGALATDAEVQAVKEALQKEIDDDVKVVADALADQMNIDVKDSLASQIADEAGIRSDADNALANRIKVFETGGAQDVAAKEVRLAAAEGEIDALQEFVAAQPDVDKAQDDRIKALEDANKEGGDIAEAIDAAQEAADNAQKEIDALELKVGTVAEGKTVMEVVEANRAANAEAAATADGKAEKAQDDVNDLKVLVGSDTDSKEAGTVFGAIYAGDDALQGQINSLDGRIDELEKVDHDHANKTELDKFEDGDKAALDRAVAFVDSFETLTDTEIQAEIDSIFGK